MLYVCNSWTPLTLSLNLHGGRDGFSTGVLPSPATKELSDSVLGVREGPLKVWVVGGSREGEGEDLHGEEAGALCGPVSWDCGSLSRLACRGSPCGVGGSPCDDEVSTVFTTCDCKVQLIVTPSRHPTRLTSSFFFSSSSRSSSTGSRVSARLPVNTMPGSA
jgi:hypothetical protein